MLRYKGKSDLYQFFSVISKSLIGPANRCSGCPPTPEAVLSLCVPPGVGREEEKVHPAASGASLQAADLARTFRQQTVAHREARPRIR